MADPILGKRTLAKCIKEYNWNEEKLKKDQKIMIFVLFLL